MRVALGLEYDGTDFNGWQIQREGRTIQRSLETALRAVADHPVRVTCAGRTDAGVHALGQVVHFDTEADRVSRAWTLGLNSNLPPDVCVRWAGIVSEEFHARFSARTRSYRYWILNSAFRPALLRNDQALGNHWLRIRLIGKSVNRDAIGAWVELTVNGGHQRRQVMPTRSFLSQMELPLTFGLGTAEAVDALRIRWPDGSVQEVSDVVIDSLMVLEQVP